MIRKFDTTVSSRFRYALIMVLAGFGISHLPSVVADEIQGTDRVASLNEMRSAAAAIKITSVANQRTQVAKLVEEPLFRYSDEQRQIRDATMWIWTIDGQPTSILKLERYGFDDPARRWLFNIGSVSPHLVEAVWPFEHKFHSKKPGLTFQSLPNAVESAASKTARLTQIKQMARRFSVTMKGNSTDKTEMRMLTTPLFQYVSESSQILDGVLFGYSATGTNPDAIIAIQLRGADLKSAKWEFAATGTTTAGLQVRLDDKQVWSQPYLVGLGQVFDTWTWFFSERAE